MVSGKKSVQKGYSLIEVLIAIGILSSLALLIGSYSTMFLDTPSMIQGSCRLYAKSILDTVREESYYRVLVNFIPTGAARSANSFGTDVSQSRAVNGTEDWWTGNSGDFNIADLDTTNANVKLQNFQLIEGSIRSLSSIYNSNPQVRCSYGTYAPLTSLGVLSNDLANPQSGVNAKISIRPFNIADNSDRCVTAVHPSPAGLSTKAPQSAFANGWSAIATPASVENWSASGPAPNPAPDTMANPGIGDSGIGLELTVLVSYTYNGRTQSCNAAQKFQYSQDRTQPLPPDLLEVQAGSNPTAPMDNCTLNRAAFPIITIGYTGAELERGSQFLCRDLSWQKNWAANTASPYGAYPPCIMHDGVGTGTDDGVIMNTVLGASENVFPNGYYDPTAQSFASRQATWVPCDQLQQCGATPAAAYNKTNPNTDATNHILTLKYPQLPPGCVMNFEAVTVDSAGNTSITATPTDRKFLEDAAPGIMVMNEIHYPTCGTYCAYDPATWTGFTSGYYTCRVGGCCTGLGCTEKTGSFTTNP